MARNIQGSMWTVPVQHCGPDGRLLVGVPREPSRRDHFLAPAVRGISVDDRMRQLAREDAEFMAARRAREAEYDAGVRDRRALQDHRDASWEEAKLVRAQEDRDEIQSFISNNYQEYTAARQKQFASDVAREDAKEDHLIGVGGMAERLEDANTAIDERYQARLREEQPGLNFSRIDGESIKWALHERDKSDAPMRKLFTH